MALVNAFGAIALEETQAAILAKLPATPATEAKLEQVRALLAAPIAASGLSPVTATLDGVETSAAFTPILGRPINLTHRRSNDFSGSYQLERKFTDDANWYVVFGYADLTDLPETFSLTETESGVTYRWNMTAHTAGSVAARISA